MLDISEDDELDIEEFVAVCLRAKTLTRPVDLQSFVQQSRRTHQVVQRHMERLESRVESVALKLDSAARFTNLGDGAARRGVTEGLRRQHRGFPNAVVLGESDGVSKKPALFQLKAQPSRQPLRM